MDEVAPMDMGFFDNLFFSSCSETQDKEDKNMRGKEESVNVPPAKAGGNCQPLKDATQHYYCYYPEPKGLPPSRRWELTIVFWIWIGIVNMAMYHMDYGQQPWLPTVCFLVSR